MESIFHAGDKVRIKSDIPNGVLTVNDMQTYSGLETTIIRVETFDPSVDGFCYVIEDCPYFWEATAFEKIWGAPLDICNPDEPIQEGKLGEFFNNFKVV